MNLSRVRPVATGCALLALAASGCQATQRGGLLGPASAALGVPTVGSGAEPSLDVWRDLPEALPAPAAVGRPFGLWGLNGRRSPAALADVADRFNLTVFQTASAHPTWAVGTLLPRVRAAGLSVTLRMTPNHDAYTTPSGDFDLAAWKAHLAKWAGADVQPFIDDGTLAGHMLLDDIATFAGRDPDAADLDEMARYSAELLPGLLTFVREDATALPVPAAGTYVHLDATVNQYLARKGDVTQYAQENAARAAELGLGVINGLNLCDGGDGASGQPGWRADRYAMSAAEIRRYGQVLATVPSCGMFLAWEYDADEPWPDGTFGSTYFDQPDLQAALAELGVLLAGQPRVRLLRSGH